MKLIKLTDNDNKTKNNTLWGENVTHELPACDNPRLCSKDVIHAYKSVGLALLMNRAHTNYDNPNVWEAKGDIVVDDGAKCGVFKLTTLKQIEPPQITITQRIAFGILCALEVYKKPDFIDWANNWLSGADRTADAAAYAAANSANEAYAAYAAAYAAKAAKAAAYAADAAYAAAYAAANSANAAYAAAYADITINFEAIALKAMTYTGTGAKNETN